MSLRSCPLLALLTEVCAFFRHIQRCRGPHFGSLPQADEEIVVEGARLDKSVSLERVRKHADEREDGGGAARSQQLRDQAESGPLHASLLLLQHLRRDLGHALEWHSRPHLLCGGGGQGASFGARMLTWQEAGRQVGEYVVI
eukprot:6212531-Pleurochrysis_carterae.AAC.2